MPIIRPIKLKYSRELRKKQTKAEKIFWNAVRNRQCCNLKFRRQHCLLGFIVDFYCHELKLCIEIDGGIHLRKDVHEYDRYREKALIEAGYMVVRFSNEEVILNSNGVIEKISLMRPVV